MILSYKKIIYYATLFIIFILLSSRLHMYLSPKDIWVDEGYIYYAISHSDILSIFTQGLKLDQSSPFLFILLNSLFIDVFGSSPIVLATVPFLFSLLSIFLFYKLGTRWYGLTYAFIALFLFSICMTPLYYSTEFKSYGTELTINLCVILWGWYKYIQITKGASTIFGFFSFAYLFACILLASSAVLTVFPTLLIVAIYYIYSNNYKIYQIFKYNKSDLFYFLILLICLAVYYFIYLKKGNNEAQRSYWISYFIPHNIYTIIPYIKKTAFKIYEILFYPTPTALLILFGFFPGLVFLFIKNKYIFFLLFLPILSTVASNFFFYPPGTPYFNPWGARLLLFLVPNIIFISAFFYYFIFNLFYIWLKKRSRIFLTLLTLIILVNVICASVLINFRYIYKNLYKIEQITQLVSYIATNIKPDDKLYVYHFSDIQYVWVSEHFNINNKNILFFSGDELLNELKNQEFQNRIFILFTHHRKENFDKFENGLDLLNLDFLKFNDYGSLLYIVTGKQE